MAKTFKKGHPRNGQWVLVDGKTLGIAVQCNRIDPKTGKSFFGAIGDVITKFPYPHDPDFMEAPRDGSKFQVDVVDPKTGIDTIGSLLVDVGRLTPVLDLQQIPGPRRATCAEGWSPRA